MSLTSLVSSGPLLLAMPVAAAAGALSFLSPCVLPLVPGYLSYVTGMSGAELSGTPAGTPGSGAVLVLDRTTTHPRTTAHARTSERSRVFVGALLFILGFSAVFVAEGALFGSLGATLRVHERALEITFGTVTVGLGLVFAGALSRIPLANRSARLQLRPGVGLAAAPVLGLLFGLGWTPCIGPTLGAVLGLSAQNSTAGRGAVLTAVYCLGLGVPFLVVALAFRRALAALDAVKRHYRIVSVVGGTLLVVVGMAEVTGAWAHLVRELQSSVGSGGSLL